LACATTTAAAGHCVVPTQKCRRRDTDGEGQRKNR
jgi:hypothetical protein